MFQQLGRPFDLCVFSYSPIDSSSCIASFIYHCPWWMDPYLILYVHSKVLWLIQTLLFPVEQTRWTSTSWQVSSACAQQANGPGKATLHNVHYMVVQNSWWNCHCCQ
jgi:hypothetical protein